MKKWLTVGDGSDSDRQPFLFRRSFGGPFHTDLTAELFAAPPQTPSGTRAATETRLAEG
jgi:hypothetical protein